MLIIKFLVLFITYVNLVSTESTLCGNWTQFGEQKCIHIIDKEKLVNYENAIEMCAHTENSDLITILSENEQKLIEKYLFKDKQIVDNVWIGLKNENGFKWSDKSSVDYTNWDHTTPLSNSTFTDRPCVQISSEISLSGKWVNAFCAKKAVVVCQKSFDFKTILEKIKNLEKENHDLNTKLNACLKNNPFSSEVELISRIKQFHSHYNISKSFTDSDNKQKVLFTVWNNTYPYIARREQLISLCESLNSNIIEIRSEHKQEIVNKQITEWNIRLQTNGYNYFWLNAKRDSSGKWRWNSDGMEFNYTNWDTKDRYPKPESDYNFVYMGHIPRPSNSLWFNTNDISFSHLICEHELK